MYYAKKYQVFFNTIFIDGDAPFSGIAFNTKMFTVELTFLVDGSLPLSKIKLEAEENLNVFSRQLIIHKHQLRLEMINNFLKELGRWLEVETLDLNTFVVLDMVKNQFDHSNVLSESVIKIKVWNGSKSEYSKMK